jgi:hypothetical protein
MDLPFPRTWWISPGRLLGGCFPGHVDPEKVDPRLEALLDVGVVDVICLQQEDERGGGGLPFDPYHPRLHALGAARGVEVSWVRFPVRDMTAPSEATMRAVLDRIHARAAITYVHCWGGHGRTGAVAGCWLREQGLTAEEAFAHIRAARAHDPYLREQASPQTADQHELVRRWPGRR